MSLVMLCLFSKYFSAIDGETRLTQNYGGLEERYSEFFFLSLTSEIHVMDNFAISEI